MLPSLRGVSLTEAADAKGSRGYCARMNDKGYDG